MSSLSPVGRSAAARKNDRVSLCSFTFSDGRRCRTPRNCNHPHFCFYHAQKEARARAADTLGKDLAYFFSGDYLSACDLSTALGRLIPAVLRGDVKPRAARTVAYLAQTLMQAIHISEHEYCEAFDTDDWRRAIRNSVKGNYNHRFPPAPKPEQPESPQPQPQPAPPSTPPQPVAPASTVCHHERSEESHPIPATQPAPSPHAPMPPTSTEFVQHIVAGLRTDGGQARQPQPGPASSPISVPSPPAKATQPTSVAHAFTSEALPPHVRRRLHRTTTPTHPPSPPPPPDSHLL